MSECWREGQLRAFIDRELAAEEIARVAAHLEECSQCGDLWAELAGRADRVSALMQELAGPEPAAESSPAPITRLRAWRWAAPAAVAAAMVMGVVVFHRQPAELAVAPSPVPVVHDVARIAEPPAETAHHVVALAAARPSKARPPQRIGRSAAPGLPSEGPFLALDDDPIESGVVWRVELGPRQVPADVIVDSEGRPRAIRLINFKPNQ